MNGLNAPPPLSERHVVDSTIWSKVRTKARPDLADSFNLAVQADTSARDAAAFARQADLLDLLPAVPTGQPQFRRAREVQAALAGTGRQRGVPPIDLLIAAAAETAGSPVLHYDHDDDLIASVSGPAMRLAAAAGDSPVIPPVSAPTCRCSKKNNWRERARR